MNRNKTTMMNPADGSSFNGGNARGSIDPPEEMVEMPPRSSFQSSSRKSDHLDEFETKGLLKPGHSRQSAFSSIGAGSSTGRLRSTAVSALQKHCAPLMMLCSLAWDPRNRARSAIALIFFAFLCAAMLTKNDVGASHNLFPFGRTNKKKSGNNDPFSEVSADQRLSLLKNIYGSWNFFDGSAEDRPTTPYMTVDNAGNPYLDLTEEKFPLESWQADAVYANHFLDAAEKLVKRGQRAIFSTYHGYGLSDVRVVEKDGDDLVDYTAEDSGERSTMRSNMFHMEEIDLSTVTSVMELNEAAPSWERKGGWTTARSMDGLQRR